MTLISAPELVELLDSDASVVVLDVRWSLAAPDGRAAYEAGHIADAVYVDLEADLSDHTITGRGRHPLPTGTALQASLRRWGVDDGGTVVVYDDWNRAGSARAWWVLRAAGLNDVQILDGGWTSWLAADGGVETGARSAAEGSVTVRHDDLYTGALPTLTAAEAAIRARDGVLLDARAPERYRGEVEPVDAVAGHIPGAVNLPSTAVLREDGTFADAEKLRALFGERGADHTRTIGAYCGSGVTASVLAAAADQAGLDLELFPGSWSQWSSASENPIETGDESN
ncbi:sulfurtransferase [Rhodococcus sp. NPDC127530]|uniref:sulfurtransferase n=1 Tax=unclassified Rhodococcus (in: high G+C Gram-positive bacteria) TaxID=192944 RepID=UPI00362BAF8B